MGSEKFCLRWNDFESNISNAFKELRDDKDFFDVTLACDEDQIQAHKVILSACSPFFRNILRRNPHQHPLLYMKGMKFTDLQSVLNFMYHGEVSVAQEELNSFLAVAEDLRVKGLTQNQSVSNQSTSKQSTSSYQLNVNRSPAPNSKSSPMTTKREPPMPFKCSRPLPPSIQEDDDIQEVVPIKSEPISSVPHASPHTQPQVYSTIPQPVALDTTEEQSVTAYQEETGYEDYGDYQDEQGYTEADTSMDHTMQGVEQGKGLLDHTHVKSPEDLYQFCFKEAGETKWKCSICLQFKHGGRNQVRNHVESKHCQNMFEYHCQYCDKTCHTKKGLEVHISEKHRSA